MQNSNSHLNSCNACVCEDKHPQGKTFDDMTKSNQISWTREKISDRLVKSQTLYPTRA
jgi:hypothetical protein